LRSSSAFSWPTGRCSIGLDFAAALPRFMDSR
jgi:hypothetical protein